MKKLLLVLFCAFTALTVCAQEKNYTDNLKLTIDGQSVDIPEVTVLYQDNGDGTANFLLKNFYLSDGSNIIPVGNIRVLGMPVKKEVSYDSFEFHDKIILENGDDEALPEGMDMWIGPILFSDGLYLNLYGKANDEKLFVLIDLDITELGIEGMGQVVEVQFGSDFSENENEDSVNDILSRITIRSSNIYDLSGRKVEKPSSGIYVVNGKKVVL